MNPELYLTFVLATILLIIIPGPNVSLIVANAIAFGRRQGLVTVAGTATAQVFQLAVVAFGMTSFMLLLAQWFEWLRWAGVAYLLWLGYQHWREDPASVTPEQLARRASTKTARSSSTPACRRRPNWLCSALPSWPSPPCWTAAGPCWPPSCTAGWATAGGRASAIVSPAA